MSGYDYLILLFVLVVGCPALVLLPFALLWNMGIRINDGWRKLYWIGIGLHVFAIAMYPAYLSYMLWVIGDNHGGSGIFLAMLVPFAWLLSVLGTVFIQLAVRGTTHENERVQADLQAGA